MITITPILTTLTDGSKVVDIDLSQDEVRLPIRLSCVSDKDAYALIDKLKAAIHDHTVDDVLIDKWVLA
jgi:hypothetical protein